MDAFECLWMCLSSVYVDRFEIIIMDTWFSLMLNV